MGHALTPLGVQDTHINAEDVTAVLIEKAKKSSDSSKVIQRVLQKNPIKHTFTDLSKSKVVLGSSK